MPQKDLEGMSLFAFKTSKLEVKDSSEVSGDFIASVRFKFKVAYFNYRKAKAKWKKLFQHVDKIVQHPVHFDSETLIQNKLKKRKGAVESGEEDFEIALVPIENSSRTQVFFKVMAVVCILYSLMILTTQAIVIFNPEYTLPYWVVEGHMEQSVLIVVFTVAFLASIVMVCFFTIFSLRINIATPCHTDCLSFAAINSNCNKIITVTCLNYMSMLNELDCEGPFCTSYLRFYSSMIDCPFIGENYNLIMSSSIIGLGVLFAVISGCRLQNKAWMAVSKVRQAKEEISEREQTLASQIKQGEQAILLEYDSQKTKEDRKKLLRFNVVEEKNSIELNQQRDRDEILEALLAQNELKKEGSSKSSEEMESSSSEEEEGQKKLSKKKGYGKDLFKKRKLSESDSEEEPKI